MQQRWRSSAEINRLYRLFSVSCVPVRRYFVNQAFDKRFPLPGSRDEIKIAVGTGLFTKRYVKIKTAHDVGGSKNASAMTLNL